MERVEQTHIKLSTDGIEKPSVRIDLLLVLLLHTEDDLCRHNTLVRVSELEVLVQPERRGILEEMSSDWLVVYHVLHMIARLVYPK